ncbi:bifunctional GTP diphosphokinase/guanosine-3',5'-bis pyrophosphate 3'-pyrophosphohydrolase [Exilibacterium tricleocarpae]|uniref:guanosine-3',5'-bis(diphosphate) 3'-diphosphatase n=1 Tax=Exilibacterium tricleocarpae TaxID=2591008 RepID=A0A545TZB8_9GAMM|nr:bifunctional GTP diphosphokinase/guanosine-3',5'-bis pyrophosphate 3'-pyrophosphohydrolase [Exilibacterium tricleocarpae]TQV82560.1 bifunctional GTP diphosphokinase/guanosine-3',5'-bis pyrophosphate 3'-pyrophosphohydrolase [Exilibacterium tricleocarpae]
MQTIDALSHRLSSYLEAKQINLVRRAYYYADQAHFGQLRRSGEPYITHPLAVANVLANMHMDHQSLAAAMLHDVIEDTGIGKQALTDQFGDTVAELVDGVSKLTQIEFESQAEKQAENFQKMALAMAKDIRVILVKLADRLHNMRTLAALNPEKKRRIAKETLEIYAPIANRLGMNDMRVEFEDRGFSAMYPLRTRRLQAALQTARGNRKELVEKIQQTLELRLEREGITALIIGREKHLFSIYQKMRQKKKSFKEIMDVYAFRIIVHNVDTCYRVLGAIHNLYKPIVSEFKDYIAIPKANGYQSLHTVLLGMHGVPIEVQIRTKEMDEMANNGIAAHWLYKSDSSAASVTSHARARQWVQGLLEIQQRAGNSLEFIENVKIDLFPDEVYVFTPKGNIVELPSGATPVDFAYAVHTDIGHSCVACRINERLAPLSQPLQSGQKVTVITAPGAQPNPNWLDFVASGKARSAIRHFLKNQRHHESIELGRRMLNRALSSSGTHLDKLDESQVRQLLHETHAQSLDSLLEDIGLGNRIAQAVAKLLRAETAQESAGPGNIYSPLMIESADSLMISFARCCRPIPGDPIIGHISAGKGLVIHQDTCRNVSDLRSNPEKINQVNWAPTVTGEFLVDVRVEVESERGIIATLATRITEQGANIEQINVDERDAHNSVINLCIGVNNRIHLANIMRRIRNMHSVIRISRSKN